MARFFTTQEKLDEVERLIEEVRPYVRTGDQGNTARLEVLKAVALELRGRLAGKPSVALLELERRLAAVQRSKTSLGYDLRVMRSLADELIARWPTVKQSLEKFGAAVEFPR